MTDFPFASPEERQERADLVVRLARNGADVVLVDHQTMVQLPCGGKGAVCFVNDDPKEDTEPYRSLGPDGFPELLELRKSYTHCLIEGGVAPPPILARLGELVNGGSKVMWIVCRETQEIAWTHWAQDASKGEWLTLSVISAPDGKPREDA